MQRARLAAVLAIAGCGAAPEPIAAPPVIELEPKAAPAPARCDATQVVRAALALPLELTVDLAALRAHPDVVELGHMLEAVWVFQGTAIDLLEHFDVTFVAGPGAAGDRRSYFFVAQHQLESEQLGYAFAGIAERWHTEPLADLPVPALRILPTSSARNRGAKGVVVAAVSPTIVAVASEPYLAVVQKLVGCDRVSRPAAGALVEAVVQRPGAALAGLPLPELPPSIERVDAHARLDAAGVEIVIEAPTPSEADASALAEAVDAALRERVGEGLPLPDFRAEGSRLVGRRILTPLELVLFGAVVRVFREPESR